MTYPKHAKFGRARNFDIVVTAFLSTKAWLFEYDKPYYDQKDVYLQPSTSPLLYQEGNILKLKEGVSFETTVSNFKDLYPLREVEMYIDPQDLVNFVKRADDLIMSY